MDADTIASIAGVVTAIVAGSAAAIVKRRKGKKGSAGPQFKPRVRAKFYLSMRSHESDPPPNGTPSESPQSEPPIDVDVMESDPPRAALKLPPPPSHLLRRGDVRPDVRHAGDDDDDDETTNPDRPPGTSRRRRRT